MKLAAQAWEWQQHAMNSGIHNLYIPERYRHSMPRLDKEIIVMGDIEMGAGNLTDDFISDNALSELIVELGKRKHPVDLVLNGDTFDFLKCPYLEHDTISYPRHITANISLNKLGLIAQAHPAVFAALKQFVAKKDKQISFIIGNHDLDLAYPEVQKKIRAMLWHHVHFKKKYCTTAVHVEHGHQYDFLNRVKFDSLFLHYHGKQILNLPFVSFGLISRMMQVKEEHPFMERVFPRQHIAHFHKVISKKMTMGTLDYFLKSIFYYPFRYYFDPTYRFPRDIVRECYRRIKQIHWEVDGIIDSFKGKNDTRKSKIYVLGHVHEKYLEDKGGVVIIQPGSWRDEYDLDAQTKMLIPRPKRYVQILMQEGKMDYQLITIPQHRSAIAFDDAVKDEIKYIKQAASQEGFEPRLIQHRAHSVKVGK